MHFLSRADIARQPASQIGQSLHSGRDRGDRGHFCEVRRPPPRRRRFFLRVVGELGFHNIAVERALLVGQGRRSRARSGRRRASIAPPVRQLVGISVGIGNNQR
jgi:hypothetical protein